MLERHRKDIYQNHEISKFNKNFKKRRSLEEDLKNLITKEKGGHLIAGKTEFRGRESSVHAFIIRYNDEKERRPEEGNRLEISQPKREIVSHGEYNWSLGGSLAAVSKPAGT